MWISAIDVQMFTFQKIKSPPLKHESVCEKKKVEVGLILDPLVFSFMVWVGLLPFISKNGVSGSMVVLGLSMDRVGLGLELTRTWPDWVGWLRIRPVLDQT